MEYKILFKIYNPLTGCFNQEEIDFPSRPSHSVAIEWMEGFCKDMLDKVLSNCSISNMTEFEKEHFISSLMEESSWKIINNFPS